MFLRAAQALGLVTASAVVPEAGGWAPGEWAPGELAGELGVAQVVILS